MPLEAAEDVVRAAAVLHARMLGIAEPQIDAVAAVVRAALAHPMLDRARAASVCRRELPLTLATGDAIVEGIADLAFEEGDQWVVVDFKTDIEIGRLGLERYRRQVGFYAAAIERATGKRARGTLLRL